MVVVTFQLIMDDWMTVEPAGQAAAAVTVTVGGMKEDCGLAIAELLPFTVIVTVSAVMGVPLAVTVTVERS